MEQKTANVTYDVRAIEALAAIVGQSPCLRQVIQRLPTIARNDGTVLIAGETGTGKELVARAIHYLGPRAPFPFVPVNCGAFPDTLVEAELFGHERGAFTDAHGARRGLVSEAQGGTLCLDEVDSLTSRAQVVLLRLLENRTFRPIGSSREQRADVRFVAITNTRLPERVVARAFRADLYYRLSVFTVELPPLRERKDDVPLLAEHFLRVYARADGPIPHLSSSAAAALVAYDWTGNVRELENAILRATQTCSDGVVKVDDLDLPRTDAAEAGGVVSFTVLKRRAIEAFERDYLITLMRRSSGNVTQAARAAGKDRRDLGRLLRKHRLDPRTFGAVPSSHLGGKIPPTS